MLVVRYFCNEITMTLRHEMIELHESKSLKHVAADSDTCRIWNAYAITLHRKKVHALSSPLLIILQNQCCIAVNPHRKKVHAFTACDDVHDMHMPSDSHAALLLQNNLKGWRQSMYLFSMLSVGPWLDTLQRLDLLQGLDPLQRSGHCKGWTYRCPQMLIRADAETQMLQK